MFKNYANWEISSQITKKYINIIKLVEGFYDKMIKLKNEILEIMQNGRITTKKIAHINEDIIKSTPHLNSNASIQERCFNIINNMNSLPLCKCGNTVESFSRLQTGYRKYCSINCAVKYTREQNPHIELKRKEKIRETFKHIPLDIKLEKAKRVLKTRIKNGVNLPVEMKKDYAIYHRAVWKLTNRLDIKILQFSDLRGRTTYHLDHIFSIKEGFENNILPTYIANINNLRFIPAIDNCIKSSKSHMSKQMLSEVTTPERV